ncbi:adenylate/guanylate cyclase domain-containing protein [Pseudoalteromonas xiamenensis]|uniref:nucleotide-binding domain-containing protein n=1 Tax=Pseudoalteromonas xiamenensis TaxID=882626 RepID=UPI0035E6A6FA
MSKLKGIYGSLEQCLDEGFSHDFQRTKPSFRSNSAVYDASLEAFREGKNASLEAEVVKSTTLINKEFDVKKPICTAFGKTYQDGGEIGGHPDFNHLNIPGVLEKGFVVSLFLDIKGSTKLGVTYDPEVVYFIKNTIIRCAIETIQAFGGHVHRIMGDAVLAFFRTNRMARNSAIDAINCGTYIVEFMKSYIKPRLAQSGVEKDVGIRIGIDYGDKESVLWGMYGYTNYSEVTATSFFVDIAAKLQQQAPRNRVLLGQSIKELLDLPDNILETKKVNVKGESVSKIYVEPNYTDAYGKKVNYEQFVLKHDNYLSLLPGEHNGNETLNIRAVLKKDGEAAQFDYYPCSEVIKTSLGIEFKVEFELGDSNSKDIEVKFRVENTGREAKEAGEKEGVDYCNHDTRVVPTPIGENRYKAKHFEGADFLGLHFMHISVIDNEKNKVLIPERTFSIFVGDPILES